MKTILVSVLAVIVLTVGCGKPASTAYNPLVGQWSGTLTNAVSIPGGVTYGDMNITVNFYYSGTGANGYGPGIYGAVVGSLPTGCITPVGASWGNNIIDTTFTTFTGPSFESVGFWIVLNGNSPMATGNSIIGTFRLTDVEGMCQNWSSSNDQINGTLTLTKN